MHFEFSKYHGNGNDFVIINNMDNTFSASNQKIANICDRRFGIGADGFILINRSKVSDFEMNDLIDKIELQIKSNILPK